MILAALLMGSQLMPQSFLGGTGLDLAKTYQTLSDRSVVCSERVVNAYGPTRFRKDAVGNVSMADPFVQALYNRAQEVWTPPAGSPGGVKVLSQVDTLYASIYPPSLVGVLPMNGLQALREKKNHPGTLKLTIFPNPIGLSGAGSENIRSLQNLGLKKSITFPSLFGDLWFSASLCYASEIDFLTAIARLSDCQLKEDKNSYRLEPDPTKIRERFLKTMEVMGTDTEDWEGIRSKVRYRAWELASDQIVIKTVSDPKYVGEVSFPPDPEFVRLCDQLKTLSIERFVKEGRQEKREFKKNGRVRFVYGYAFTVGLQVEMSDGAFWMM